MDFDFDIVMLDPRGKAIQWKPDGETAEDWTLGDAMANCLCLPLPPGSPPLKSAPMKRILLADRLAQGGTGRLSTDERSIILEASRSTYGLSMPLIAGRIEMFIERKGPFAADGEEADGD